MICIIARYRYHDGSYWAIPKRQFMRAKWMFYWNETTYEWNILCSEYLLTEKLGAIKL